MNIGKHPVLQGHPLHAMLSDLPTTLTPLSLLATLKAARSRRFRRPADMVLDLAIAAAAATGATGWWDWTLTPSDHPAKSTATKHGLINSSLLMMLIAARMRRNERTAILAAANAGMMVGAWLGGDLVYHHGWRVRPAEEKELVEKKLGGANRQVFEDVSRQLDEFEREETTILVDRSNGKR